MTAREKANEELKNALKEVYSQWAKKYDINDNDVFFSDGEYDPYLSTVLDSIVVVDDDCEEF